MPQDATNKPLTLAERKLLSGLATGEPTDDQAYDAGIEEQAIRGSFIRALLCGEIPESPIKDLSTLHLRNALIVGVVDLSECGGSNRMPNLNLENSVLTDGAIVTAAKLGSLRLTGCCILGRGISADGARFAGDVAVCDCCFSPNASLRFARARIEGSCTLSNLCCLSPLPEILEQALLLGKTINKRSVESTHTGESEASAETSRLADVNSSSSSLKAIQAVFFEDIRALFPKNSYRGMLGGKTPGLSMLSLKAAEVSGDLNIKGIYIRSCPHRYDRDGSCKELHAEDCSALDAERVRVAGNLFIASTTRYTAVFWGGINISFANVSGHMGISGARIKCGGQRHAIDAEGSDIKGHASIEEFESIRSSVRGGLRILGIRLQGQLLLHGVLLCGRRSASGNGRAIIGDGAVLHSDVYIRSVVHGAHYLRSTIWGTVALPGATVDGQLGILGTRIKSESPDSRAMFMRDINVKGGIFLGPYLSRRTQVYGEIHLNDAVITGVFEVVGSWLKAGKNGFAIIAFGINIKGDLLFARRHPERKSKATDYEGCRISGCLGFAGATIGGRLRMFGVALRSHPAESSLIASGSSIKGGFFVQPSQRENGRPVLSTIVGALRLNNVQIGSRIRLKAAIIHASNRSQKIAISANGAVLSGDLLLSPDDKQTPCRVYGEIRLYGARISGAIKIQAGRLRARSDGEAYGCAIDAYNAEIAKGVLLGPSRGEQNAVLRPLSIYGIIGFAYTKLGSFSLGESPQQGYAEFLTLIEGQLRLNGAQINEFTAVEQVQLCAPAAMHAARRALADKIMKTLNRWDKTDSATIVSARSANFGTRLSIRLSATSTGMLDLFGARVITLDDEWGDNPTWGQAPTGEKWSNGTASHAALVGVRLNLNGFTYNRFVSPSSNPSAGVRSQLARRCRWLRQQYPNDRASAESFMPDAYIQLTSVFRGQGMNREADRIIRERRREQARYGTMSRFDRILQLVYGWLFGFGYSSNRAMLTLFVLVLMNLAFAFTGHRQGWLVEGSTPVSPTALLHISFSLAPAASLPLVGAGDGTYQSLPSPSPKSCSQWTTYALDQTLPVIHVTAGSPCQVVGTLASVHQVSRVLLLFAGWIIVPTALLTFSGILRETNK